jgi:hypothetical protein
MRARRIAFSSGVLAVAYRCPERDLNPTCVAAPASRPSIRSWRTLGSAPARKPRNTHGSGVPRLRPFRTRPHPRRKPSRRRRSRKGWLHPDRTVRAARRRTDTPPSETRPRSPAGAQAAESGLTGGVFSTVTRFSFRALCSTARATESTCNSVTYSRSPYSAGSETGYVRSRGWLTNDGGRSAEAPPLGRRKPLTKPKIAGMTISVSSVEEIMPPIISTAMRCIISEPVPVLHMRQGTGRHVAAIR